MITSPYTSNDQLPVGSPGCQEKGHRMSGLVWELDDGQRFAAIRDELAQVSTATACQLLISLGWRNTYMLGLQPLQPLGLGERLVGRARTCRYLMRRGPEGPHDPAA